MWWLQYLLLVHWLRNSSQPAALQYILRTANSVTIINIIKHSKWIILLGHIACTQCIRCGLLLQMLHIVWSVCLSVGHIDVPCEKDWTDQDSAWVADSGEPKEPCIRWGWRSHRKGQFWGLSSPMKSIESLSGGVHSKRDHTVISTVCSKIQNSLATRLL